MKLFDFDPTSFSKREIFVSGIPTYLYNSDVLVPYIEDFNKKLVSGERVSFETIPVNVHYLVHQRQGDYRHTEAIAYTVLKQYYEKTTLKVPLICVTFDNRNHGMRNIDKERNAAWSSGNATHAMDMVSLIDGMVEDIKLVMDYLPAHLNLEYHLSDEAKANHDTKIRFQNILSGYSMGGHTIIRFANKYPEDVKILNPVIACPDMSSLLINRLMNFGLDSPNINKSWFYYDYNELALTEDQRRHNYPEAFHNYLRKIDKSIFEDFLFSKINLFACFGEDDNEVPPCLSKLWIQIYQNTNPNAEVFTQSGIGHDVSLEMVDKFTSYIVRYL